MQPARSDKAGGDLPAAVRPPEGEIVLIPKQLRMEWTDLLVCDPEIPDFAVRVALVIATHFNRLSGDGYPTKERIAAIMGKDPTKVWRAVAILEARGYLVVTRRDLGKRDDGRRVAGGKGMANTYAPACAGQRVVATARGLNLAERCKQLKERMLAKRAASKQCKNALQSDDPTEGQSSSVLSPEQCKNALPTLTDPSDQNPTRARAAAPPANSTLRRANHLGDGGAVLEDLLGKLDFRSWFEQVRVVGIEGETLTLSVPSKFQRDWIRQKFERSVIDAWRRTGASIRTLAIEVRT